MRKVLLSGLLIIFTITSYAQELDTDSITTYKAYKDKGEKLFDKGKYLSAIKAYKKAIKNTPSHLIETKIKLYYSIGNSFQNSADRDSAKYYFKQGDLLCMEPISLSIKARQHHNKASIFYPESKTDSAMFHALKSLDYATKSSDTQLQILANTAIGLIFLKQKNFTKSSHYFNTSYKLSRIENKPINIAISLSNLGLVELEKKNFEKVEENFKKALLLFERENHIKGIIICKGSLARMYLAQGKLNKTVEIGQDLLPLISEIEYSKDAKKMVSNANRIHDLSLGEKNDNASIHQAQELLKKNFMHSENKNIELIQNEAFIDVIEKNTPQKKIKIKYDSVDLDKKMAVVLSLKDSLYQVSLKGKYQELETKYQTELKEKDNLKLIAEKAEQGLALEKENKQKWFFGFGLITSLITLGIFGFYFKRNKKQKELIESFHKELHHRVKNNLAIIDTFIEVTKEDILDNKLIEKLNDLQNRIFSINQVHRQLYRKRDITHVNFKEYIGVIADNIKQSFNTDNIQIKKTIDPKLSMKQDKSFPIGLIVNEFLTNSYKYAFKEKQVGNIHIGLKEINNQYLLELSDNGKGFPNDFDIEKTESFGLRMMQLLTEQLKGKFDINNKNGVQLKIQFPKH